MTERQGVSPDALSILCGTTPPDEVRQRQGPGGKMLDYIDARYVMDVLDGLGQENWRDEFVDRVDGSVRCGISILVDGEWVTKWDVGTASDIEPEKGAYSEAFKRAAVKWGIARDLYGHAPSRPAQAAHAPQQQAQRPPMPRPASTTVPPEPDGLMDGGQAVVPPMCPAHRWAMKPARDGGWFCTGKGKPGFAVDSNGYCGEKA